ncbi:MAG TPA: acyl-CoA-binding protein [Acidimicrobiia bacterium]|nr:acyl-CoA-binding protein [Acidimicrobiia bacterium]
MSDLSTRFEAAAESVQLLAEKPDNADLLKLYAFFKQGSSGDVTGKRPGMMDFVARAKYDAWASIAGMTKDDAMQAYIDLVASLEARRVD